MNGKGTKQITDEEIDLIFSEFESDKKRLKEDPDFKEQNLSDEKIMNGVLNRLGIIDTINIPDMRTFQLIKEYEFYRYAPHLINNSVWKEAYIILSRLEPRTMI